MIVVACNTATAMALESMQSSLSIPVVGVIAPGARAATKVSRGGVVAVIGTPGTIGSGAYQQALIQLNPKIEIRSRACPLFVPLAEEGWLRGEVPRLVAQKYLLDGFLDSVDTLVLGCTHYPLLADTIGDVVGNSIQLVDSAEATAIEVAQLLTAKKLHRVDSTRPHKTFLVTDTPARFLEVGTRFLGEPVTSAQQIDLHLK
jgi:glutamate racemase